MKPYTPWEHAIADIFKAGSLLAAECSRSIKHQSKAIKAWNRAVKSGHRIQKKLSK